MLTRRSLLIHGIRATALLPTLAPGLLRASAHRRDEPILVVLQLTGGNDGLNTVVPWDQDDYWRLRPSLGLDRRRLHRLSDHSALHPSLGGMAELYHTGRLAILQGVGLPEANRSHFRSMEVWHTASFAQPLPRVGWLGHMADRLATGAPGSLPALAIGDGPLPLSMHAEHSQPSAVRDPKGLRLDPRAESIASARASLLEHERSGDLDFLAQTARAAYGTAKRLEDLDAGKPAADYPQTELAQGFALVAQLVAAGLGCRLFHLQLDGFDTHARQAPIHADRLAKVSGALSAFQADLAARGLAEQVRTLVFSEFGRRAQENGSKGTDHGHGAPCFLVGEGIDPGLHGQAPRLDALVDGDVPATTDFRSVYAGLERDWMGVPSSSQARTAPRAVPKPRGR